MTKKERIIDWIATVLAQVICGFAFGVGIYAALYALAVMGAFPVVGD